MNRMHQHNIWAIAFDVIVLIATFGTLIQLVKKYRGTLPPYFES